VVTSVPLVDVAAGQASVADEVLAELARIAADGRFVLGPRVEAFERWLAGNCGASQAVAVASGTDAIELALRALGIAAGDTVVTPSFSFVAAAEAIASAGARPLFCDVDPSTMNMSAATLEAALHEASRRGLRVKAAVPVHLFGRCAPMAELAAVAKREGLVLVEDAAQAMGARDASGRCAGASSAAGCFSFFPTKNLGGWGDGGAVVTSLDAVADRVRRLRAHGAVSPFMHAELGRNSRLDAVQAAVLLAKAPHLGAWARARERIAARYGRELSRLPLDLPSVPDPPAVHAWNAYVVRVSEGRDALAAWLRERGVETRVYYPAPLHAQPALRALAGARDGELPASAEACRTALALPMFPTLSDDQQARVIEQTRAFFARP
jgi:dTDP-4-amino-4,6-dideoxygalactose transaminase